MTLRLNGSLQVQNIEFTGTASNKTRWNMDALGDKLNLKLDNVTQFEFTGLFPYQKTYEFKKTVGTPIAGVPTSTIEYVGKVTFAKELFKAYLELNTEVIELLDSVYDSVLRKITFKTSTSSRLQIPGSAFVNAPNYLHDGKIRDVSFVFSEDFSKVDINMPFYPLNTAANRLMIASGTVTSNFTTYKNLTPARHSQLTPVLPLVIPPRAIAETSAFCHVGPSGFPLLAVFQGPNNEMSPVAFPWFTRTKLNCDVMELWSGNIRDLTMNQIRELKTCADAHNVQIIGMLSDRENSSNRELDFEIEKGYNYQGFQAANSDPKNREMFVKSITEPIEVYKTLGLKYIRVNANTNIYTADQMAADENKVNEVVAIVAESFNKILKAFSDADYQGMLLLENHSVLTFKADYMIKIFNAVKNPRFALLADNNNWGTVNTDGTRGPYKVTPSQEYIKILPYTYVLCFKIVGNLGTPENFIPKSLANETTTPLFDWVAVMTEWKRIISTPGVSKLSVPPLRAIFHEPEYQIVNDIAMRTKDYLDTITYMRNVISSIN